MAEVVHLGKDCRATPIGHGLYGRDVYDHRERGRGRIEHSGCGALAVRGKRASLPSVRERSRRLLVRKGFKLTAIRAKVRQVSQSSRTGGMLPLPAARSYETGLPLEVGIPRFWGSVVPVVWGIGMDIVYSSTLQFGSEESTPVLGCCVGTFSYVDRPESSDYGPKQRTGLTGRDIRGTGTFLRHHTTG